MSEKQKPPSDYWLPMVKPEIVTTVNANAEEVGAEVFLREGFEQMKAQNPVLLDSVADFVDTLGVTDPTYLQLVFDTAVIVHELLQNQAQADALNRELA